MHKEKFTNFCSKNFLSLCLYVLPKLTWLSLECNRQTHTHTQREMPKAYCISFKFDKNAR